MSMNMDIDMDYIGVFNDVTAVLNKDYAGFLDKKGWGREAMFRERLLAQLEDPSFDDLAFEDLVTEYLMDYKDGHMFFYATFKGPGASSNSGQEKPKIHIGFSVRRYGDKLYVTEVFEESRLKVGDVIDRIGGYTIEALEVMHSAQVNFQGHVHERQKWGDTFKKYPTFSLQRGDESTELERVMYGWPQYVPEYSIKALENGVLLLTLSDFSNDDAINQLIRENHQGIMGCRGLIIDVRHNRGGSDSAYFELLRYMFSEDVSLLDLDNEQMEINFSERTCNLRKEMFETQAKQFTDPQTQLFLKAFLKELDDNWGKGLQLSTMNQDLEDTVFKAHKQSGKIVVLSDTYCGSSGDAFVNFANRADMVTTMGRPSAGITDYSNLAVQSYGERFNFLYPTSRNCSIDEGLGISGKGHPVDVYIPWTPEHLVRDVDLDRAMSFWGRG